MAARVVLSRRAQVDLRRLWRFVVDESGRDRANAVVARIRARCQLRAAHPLSGRARPELRQGIRSFPVFSEVVLYVPLPDGILVERVVHGSRDLRTAFEEPGEN